jgi:c-di-GMP-binding flagellar brake protein YcgR
MAAAALDSGTARRTKVKTNDTEAAAEQRKCWELLAALQTLHTAVAMRNSKGKALGVGMVLAVDPERGVLLLDVPVKSHAHIETDELMRLEAQIEGRRLEFTCHMQRIVQLPDGPAFLANKPILRVDKQRRAAYRVHLPSMQDLQAAIADDDGKELDARLIDISILGFGARVPAPVPFAEGVTVRCRISLPDLDLNAEATVRHNVREMGATRLGMQFKALSPAMEQSLNRAVVKLERMILRSRSGRPPATSAPPRRRR